MPPLSSRGVYGVLLAAIVLSGVVLGYLSWQNASRLERLGEQTIAQSVLEQVRERVQSIELHIIRADNRVFELLDLEDPGALPKTWAPLAKELSPSVRAVVVLDERLRRLGISVRGGPDETRPFWNIFLREMLPEMDVESLETGRLKHLHVTIDDTNYLISYKWFATRKAERILVVLHHDAGFLVREEFPTLLEEEDGLRIVNVLDERSGRRIFGESLSDAGSLVVGIRFPTTFYGWRLQAAPREAPRLKERMQSQRVADLALIIIALGTIMAGVAFLIAVSSKERRVADLKSQFVVNVSHELKTPVSVIRMFSEMLMSGRARSDEKREEYVRLIARESDRLSQLVENVLDFSALEQGQQRYAFSRHDLSQLVDEAVDTFVYRADEEGVQVTREPGQTCFSDHVDREAVILAVLNLLDNALKYGRGSPIVVRTTNRDGKFRVEVEDHGPGIPPNDQEKVFDRFFRSAGKEQARGSGIGLAVVKSVARAHKGSVQVDSEMQDGTRMLLDIPI